MRRPSLVRAAAFGLFRDHSKITYGSTQCLCEGRGMARRWVGLVVALLALGLIAPAAASAQGETAKVLIYSGTTGYRHANGGEAIQPAVVELIQSKLQAAGIASDYRTC